MKDVPEIAPEIRGLLEEIVADPRSAIRLAPRRALRSWFDTGETVRASDIVRTKAEKHLVEVHREELAALLCEASWISYWKAPGLAHRPIGANGRLYNPAEREQEWARRAKSEQEGSSWGSNGIELLRQCLLSISPRRGLALAKASLSLVPRDTTRCYVALNIPWSEPRTAIAFFGRLERRVRPPSLRADILLSLAARTCSLGLLRDARILYQEASALSPHAPYGRMWAFNLSCFLGDPNSARVEARSLSTLVTAEDPRLSEARGILHEWLKTRSEAEVKKASSVCENIRGEVSKAAEVLCQAIIP